MAEFVAAAGKAERSTLNAAIAPRGFPPLQLREFLQEISQIFFHLLLTITLRRAEVKKEIRGLGSPSPPTVSPGQPGKSGPGKEGRRAAKNWSFRPSRLHLANWSRTRAARTFWATMA